MCLGVPFRLVIVDGHHGLGDFQGVRKEIDLRMLPGASVGDYVLVHAGFAVQKIDRGEAEANVRLFEELLLEP